MATLAFESANGGLPALTNLTPQSQVVNFSPQVVLLQYLDQTTLYNSINFVFTRGGAGETPFRNATAASLSIAAFLCPSDPNAGPPIQGVNSYRACIGLGQQGHVPGQGEGSYPTFVGVYDGAFSDPHYIDSAGNYISTVLPLAAITDGLSNTLAFSEKPIDSTPFVFSPFRDWYGINPSLGVLSVGQWTTACSGADGRELQPSSGVGISWINSGTVSTQFTAAAPPNSLIPDCGLLGYSPSPGLFTARSYHPGGVQAAMVDGSARWSSSTTQTKVWRSLGTRAGGESFGPQ